VAEAVGVGGRLPDLTGRRGSAVGGGAERVGEREVAEAGLEPEEEGRRGRVGGEEVELGGEHEGRARRGAERAEPRADGEREGEARVVGAVREAERRAGREGGGEVEAELAARVAARREARLERQPEHADGEPWPASELVVRGGGFRAAAPARWNPRGDCEVGIDLDWEWKAEVDWGTPAPRRGEARRRQGEVSSAWWSGTERGGRRLKKKLTCGSHTSVS